MLNVALFLGQWERQVDDKGVFKQGDILDEALEYFKVCSCWLFLSHSQANVLFRTFEVKGAADILLIYATLYISQCLGKIKGRGKQDAQKQVHDSRVTAF